MKRIMIYLMKNCHTVSIVDAVADPRFSRGGANISTNIIKAMCNIILITHTDLT